MIYIFLVLSASVLHASTASFQLRTIADRNNAQLRIHANATCGPDIGNGEWFYDSITDNCFFVSTILTTWPKAEEACVTMNSHLATIESGNHAFVQQILAVNPPQRTLFWIGLRLQHIPTMTHAWVDGNTANTYRAWDANEPSIQGTEGCVVMNNENGKWHDYRCQWAAGYRYVCRKTKTSETPTDASTISPVIEDHFGCPTDRTDLVRFGSSCYWFSLPNDKKNWNDALKSCQDLYSHPSDLSKSSSLVSIHNEMEQEFLVSHMYDGIHRWTGLYEENDKTTLYWADHTYMGYSNWHYPEPRPSGSPECIWLYGDPARAGLWDDASCENTAGYICKMQKDPTKQQPIAPPVIGCPVGFERHNGVCFAIVPISNNSLQGACSTYGEGVRPASVITPFENAFLHVMFNKLLNYMPAANFSAWLGGKDRSGSLKWDSGCYPKFNNIARFYTNQPGDLCIVMDYDGKWRTQNCSANAEYVVCEKREGENECNKLQPDVVGICPVGFPEQCHDYCYRLSGHTSESQNQIASKTTWEGAKTVCANMGGSLVSIRSEKDQRCVEQYLDKADSSLWIGLYYQDDLTTSNGAWKWLDQSNAYQGNYQNWEQGQPDNTAIGAAYRETCTEIHTNGLWNNVPCQNGGERGYICEKLKSPLNNATCGESTKFGDWFYDEKTDSCFYVSRTLASWPNAESTCNSMDAHLATIQTDNHAFVLQTIARDYPVNTLFWIGLRLQHVQTMTHAWVDGNVSNIYRAWDTNEPSPQGVEACVAMNNRNGKWHDYRCQWARGYNFICRKPKTPQSVVIGTTVSPAVVENWGCPTNRTDLVRFGSHCYWFSPPNEQKNWNDALKACQDLYSHPTDLSKSSNLVSIHSELEQEFLIAHMGADRINRWTGLHEEIDRSTLYWTDQSYFGFTNWNYREPMSTSQTECVMMYGDSAKAGRWNDELCGHAMGYICKMQKDSTNTAPVQAATNCPAGFENLNGTCFGVFEIASDPQSTCSPGGYARMATITSPYENAFLHVLLKKALGNAATSDAKAWLGGKEKAGKLSWNAGCFPKVNNIANFYTNQPGENCLAMDYDGKWSTQPCSDTNRFVICEKREVECEKLAPTVEGVCPVGFSDECNDFCYKIAHTSSTASSECTRVTWIEAKTACAKLGGSVLSIRNEVDQKCVEKYIEKSTSGMWIGLFEEVDPLTNLGTWKWLDEDVLYEGSYQNWAQGEPNLLLPGYTRESCVEISPDGKWNNVQCGHGATRGYICEKLKGPVVASDADSDDAGLGGGAIAGIVIAVLLLTSGLALASYCYLKRRNIPIFSRGLSVSYGKDLSGDKTSVITDNDDSYT